MDASGIGIAWVFHRNSTTYGGIVSKSWWRNMLNSIVLDSFELDNI